MLSLSMLSGGSLLQGGMSVRLASAVLLNEGDNSSIDLVSAAFSHWMEAQLVGISEVDDLLHSLLEIS